MSDDNAATARREALVALERACDLAAGMLASRWDEIRALLRPLLEAVDPGPGSIDGRIYHCGRPMQKISDHTKWTGKPEKGMQIHTIYLSCVAANCNSTGLLRLEEPC